MSRPTLDCGDNSCEFAEHKGGMRTNGGCRCLKDLDFSRRMAVRGYIKGLRARVAELERQLAEAQRRLDVEGSAVRLAQGLLKSKGEELAAERAAREKAEVSLMDALHDHAITMESEFLDRIRLCRRVSELASARDAAEARLADEIEAHRTTAAAMHDFERDADAAEAEAESLRDRLSSVTEDYIRHRNAADKAEAEVARLEGLILDWRRTGCSSDSRKYHLATDTLATEAERIREREGR